MNTMNKTTTLTAIATAYATAAAASFALGFMLGPKQALAVEPLPTYTDLSVIGGNVLEHGNGAIAVNQAAGDDNQQANVAAIAINPHGLAVAHTSVSQSMKNISGTLPDKAEARIDGNAFAHALGAIAVNQASGFANRQANSAAIAMGIRGEVIADSVLAETLPDAAGLVVGPSKGVLSVSVSETAFQGARGVVQLNQTAGSGNNSANNFALRVSAEPKL